MKEIKAYLDKRGKPSLMIIGHDNPLQQLMTFKGALDYQMKGERPKGFVIAESYDKDSLELQRIEIGIKTEKGNQIIIFGREYDASNFLMAFNKKTLEISFPNSIRYESEVTENGKLKKKGWQSR